jgi:dolichol-phosphate mannosyltransferase
MKANSVSVLIPAFNEEKNLKNAFSTVNNAVKGRFKNYEIIIFDDGSSDSTAAIADKLAKKNSKVLVIRGGRNRGLGYVYKTGARKAKYDYYAWFSASNDITLASFRNALSYVGKADIIALYPANAKKVRTRFRKIVSDGFVLFLNLLFGFGLKYYNAAIIKTRVLNSEKIHTNSFAFQAEIILRLLLKGHSYIEVPFYSNSQKGSKSKGSTLFRLKNILGILRTIIMFFKIKIVRIFKPRENSINAGHRSRHRLHSPNDKIIYKRGK